LPSSLAARTFDLGDPLSRHVRAHPEENVPMSERTSVRGQVDGLPERLLSHLDAAYNLAYWLVRKGEDAEDVVQDAYRRALQYSATFDGGDARAWLLAIVRNASYAWLRKTRAFEPAVEFDEEIHSSRIGSSNPEQLLIQNADGDLVEKALSELPVRSREVLVLRELEGLSYKEIAEVMDMPIGTVMSTLSRARNRFRHAVSDLLTMHRWSEADPVALERRECVGAGHRPRVVGGTT
jgi:RNA polymerase sigma factor (sigma-70 family)